MAKVCKESRSCYWGDALNPGYCAYNKDMKEDSVCPKLIDHWDAAPPEVLSNLLMKARLKDA